MSTPRTRAVSYEPGELAVIAQDIETRVADVLAHERLDVPGPALLALLRISASLIALASDPDTLEAALACAKDILDKRARTQGKGSLH